MNIKELQIGQEISNDQLTEMFEVANTGGMRKSRKNNLLILISDPYKGYYTNRWDGDTLYYTGTGKTGDQKLEKQNYDLANSINTGLQIHLFEVLNPKRYFYHGKVKFAGNIIKEQQIDNKGKLRDVLIFPLERIAHNYVMELEYLKQKEKLTDAEIKKRNSKEIIDLLEKHKPKTASKRLVSSMYYERNPILKEFVRRRANGKCELCKENAPFLDNKGNPFLEVHHIIWLSRNGEDTIENTVALCPNCHRKMHILEDKNDMEKLIKISKQLPDVV
ncbi:HNH endonuclease [Leptospira levettii]|uniref:HNH endonuclease n=1 Tax=Leptospira levettii TaxID=2023178 RepID=UPI00223D8176|nr:HNH endonuclease [Leptospira levettii]MCW7475611.1 HNH endonuclease [Leptospira levettii]